MKSLVLLVLKGILEVFHLYPGAELLEIRHQASHSHEAPQRFSPFYAYTLPMPVVQTFLLVIGEINPFSSMEVENIRH